MRSQRRVQHRGGGYETCRVTLVNNVSSYISDYDEDFLIAYESLDENNNKIIKVLGVGLKLQADDSVNIDNVLCDSLFAMTDGFMMVSAEAGVCCELATSDVMKALHITASAGGEATIILN